MNPVLVTNWPINQSAIHHDNFDPVFELENRTDQQNFIKPFIAVKNKDMAEILIDAGRLNYYKTQKNSKIPVYFLAADSTFFELLTAATDYFLFDNPLNNRIVAKILELLKNSLIDQKSYTNFVSKKLKISPQKSVTDKYRSFNQIIKPISDFLIRKKAPLKGWEYMAGASMENQQFYARIIKELRLSLGNFLEISENLIEYQQTNPDNYPKLRAEIQLILNSDDPNSKLGKIRNVIREKRYPRLSKQHEIIDNLISDLHQTSEINLQYDPSFERKEISGFFKLNSVEDINAVASFFNENNRKILTKIIKKL